jgi:hypothetical protein
VEHTAKLGAKLTTLCQFFYYSQIPKIYKQILARFRKAFKEGETSLQIKEWNVGGIKAR